ncbi:hypothetical protein ABI59_13350 [Acidobacteria bacterium Mor1]|nr:hypothetical protein ABI59_13350 [Acidobacteria bacterium Mor1]
MEREPRPSGVTMVAWGMVLSAVGAIGLAGATQLVGTLSGNLALGIDIRILGVVLLLLLAVAWPARGLITGEKWAWLLVCLYAFGGMIGAVFLVSRGVAGLEGAAADEEKVLGVFLSLGAASFFVVAGFIALLFLHGPKARSFFRIEGFQRWLPVVAAFVIAGCAVLFAQISSSEREAEQSLARLREIAVGQTGDDESLAFMLERLAEGSPEERLNAAYALGRSGRDEAIEPLIQAAQSDDVENVRINAIEGLSELQAEERGQAFVDLLDDENPTVRRTALAKLASPEFADHVEGVSRLLQHEDSETRSIAADALALMARQEAVPALIVATRDPEEEVRSRSAYALGKIRDPRGENALVAMLDDAEWAARANAVQALGMIGAASARPDLERLRDNDPHSQVRLAAENALDKLP